MPDRHELALRELRDFVRERDWEQFHTPKNLAMALAGEAGELVALFQWLTPEALPDAAAVESELADVYTYLLLLADVLDVDLAQACRRKLALNQERYPAHKSRGSAAKYDGSSTLSVVGP